MSKEIIKKTAEGKNLSFKEARTIFLNIFEEKITPIQVASFLTSLKIKGETDNEIAGAASIVREKSLKIKVSKDDIIFDTCGTGGSGVEKFNISTAVSFVVASSGIKVAKHGNRAVSSKSGSADVLQAMGIKITSSSAIMQQSIAKIGIGFLFAPLYHKVFKAVAPIRKELGFRTIFNILGPLCNPAFVGYQLLGVSSPDLTQKMAKVLKKLKTKSAFVCYGEKIGDEVSLCGKTKVSFLNKDKILNFVINPRDFGLKKCKLSDLSSKTPKQSAIVIKKVFKGKMGPTRDIILANAACCFYLLKRVKSLKEGVKLSGQLIDQGLVYNKYISFKEFLDKNA